MQSRNYLAFPLDCRVELFKDIFLEITEILGAKVQLLQGLIMILGPLVHIPFPFDDPIHFANGVAIDIG